MKEIFKSIKDYKGLYEISNKGKVKSLARKWISGNGVIRKKNNTILKNRLSKNSYLSVILCKDGIKKNYRITHLVWDTFGRKKRNGRILQVDHKNNNKLNDWITNLQLLTQSENMIKCYIQNSKKISKYSILNRI